VRRDAAGATPDVAAVRREVAAAFGADGPLAHALRDFRSRPTQTDMALSVFDAIVERGTLVAEAGTGTGKTFAYLVPAMLAGGKVLVSTATRALQDQVYRKDLNVLARALGARLSAAVLKGRQNYLCLHRLARTEQEGLLQSGLDAAHLRAMTRFARTSASGDRAELAEVPETAPLWQAVTSTRDNCVGTACARFDECFVYRARRAAQAADFVVVNHHLFLSDLALRDDAIREFLPSVDTVVLDEAHQLPRIAAEFFGDGWSLAQLNDLARDARVAGLAGAADGADWISLTREVEAAARLLRFQLAEAGLRAGVRTALARVSGRPALASALESTATVLHMLGGALGANAVRDVEMEVLAPRATALREEVIRWRRALDSGEQDAEGKVRWIAVTAHGAQFHATPLAPGESFARVREHQRQSWILTSATLTVAGSFDGFLSEIGLPVAATRSWESPFDFARQGLLYLPQSMPSPAAHDFSEQVADAAWPVIEASGGRAFVLCSTLRAVDRVAARLAERMRGTGADLPLLVQGTSTRPALLDAFRRAGNAVLVGSVSFWEGIDVRGEALSLVVIDKLPFAPPDDPVVEAKIRRLKALGRNPFTEFQLPQAVTLLKQGAGRLIRDERDRGVLMILDERLLSRSYGKTVIASLPPFTRSRRLQDAVDFFSRAKSG
jgi:ATP-dependent DNA helicase DinG